MSEFKNWACSTFGERFYWARRQVGLTQKAVAEALGLSRNAINAWEQDKNGAEGRHLEAAAAILKCNKTWLDTGKGRPNGAAEQDVVRDPAAGVSGYLVIDTDHLRMKYPEIKQELERLDRLLEARRISKAQLKAFLDIIGTEDGQ